MRAAKKKVLLIDLDPQGNASSGLGLHGSTGDSVGGIYDALIGSTGLKGLVRNTQIACLKLVPATIDLIGAEIELVDMEERETRLKSALKEVSGIFDYIFIDCPPSLSLLSINALAASDSVLIPIQCEYYALEGISKIIKTLELVRGGINPDLSVEGVLLTMFDSRNNLSHQVADEIRGHLGDKTYATVIPRNVRLSESPSFGKPVMLYAPNSSGALSYQALSKEFLEKAGAKESENQEKPIRNNSLLNTGALSKSIIQYSGGGINLIKRKVLGRGLGALIKENVDVGAPAETKGSSRYFLCKITDITPNRFQPRKTFDLCR